MLLLTGIYTERIVDVRTIIDITRIKFTMYIKFRHIFGRNCGKSSCLPAIGNLLMQLYGSTIRISRIVAVSVCLKFA